MSWFRKPNLDPDGINAGDQRDVVKAVAAMKTRIKIIAKESDLLHEAAEELERLLEQE